MQGTAATVNTYDLKMLYEPQCPPIFIGGCAIYGYWGGNIAVSGYASVDMLIIPSSLITGLS